MSVFSWRGSTSIRHKNGTQNRHKALNRLNLNISYEHMHIIATVTAAFAFSISAHRCLSWFFPPLSFPNFPPHSKPPFLTIPAKVIASQVSSLLLYRLSLSLSLSLLPRLFLSLSLTLCLNRSRPCVRSTTNNDLLTDVRSFWQRWSSGCARVCTVLASGLPENDRYRWIGIYIYQLTD